MIPQKTLSNGVKIPVLGYGTATIRGEKCVSSIREAISVGYRLIDTASEYGNESEIGKAVREAVISREELFISSKLWNDAHGYEQTYEAFEKTCRALQTDYLDAYLIHWPNPKAFRDKGYEEHNASSWRAMEELYEAGRIRVIGVSNFQRHHLEALIRHARVLPVIDQICLHPGRRQSDLVSFCEQNGITLQAYSPLAAGKLAGNETISAIAPKYEKTAGQIILRWHIQNDFIPLPRTVRAERMKENLEVFDFSLSDEDMRMLSELDVNIRILPDPDEADF